VLNDTETNWCDAAVALDATAFGSSGAKNEACPGTGAVGTCVENTAERPIVAPTPGSLIINEFLADPTVVGDSDGEWIEIYSRDAVDLNGLTLSNGTSSSTITSDQCLKVPAGSFSVLARNSSSLLNGNLPSPAATFTFSLVNSSGAIRILSGDILIDEIAYGTTRAGAATQLAPSKLSALFNDDAANFCTATQTYGGGADKGTPGAANLDCPAAVGASQCVDAVSGTARGIIKAQPGDLEITEFMANPSKVDDSKGEWFEVYVKADVDLNGLSLAEDGGASTLLNSNDCIHPGSGKYVLFAKSADSTVNGGLPDEVLATFTFGLSNTGAQSILIKDGTTVITQVNYSSTTSGVSSQLSSSALNPTPGQVDNSSNFCATPASATYGAGDHGTPAAPNVQCQQ
jgi:hypothetical protein